MLKLFDSRSGKHEPVIAVAGSQDLPLTSALSHSGPPFARRAAWTFGDRFRESEGCPTFGRAPLTAEFPSSTSGASELAGSVSWA